MPTDLYKDVLFSDGEGADFADLNNLRGYSGARVFDQLLEHQIGGPLGGTEPDHCMYSAHAGNAPLDSVVPIAYTLTAGEAHLFADGTPGNELRVAPGTVFQKTAAKTGDAPTFLAYEIAPADFAFTIANGDATNPRIDLVQIRLEYVNGNSESRVVQDPLPSVLQSVQSVDKKRRIQATCSVKAGTPAATPTFPAPDAGYVALGAIRVPATWVAADLIESDPPISPAAAGMMQLSVPMRVTPHVVMPRTFDYDASGANWALNVNGLAEATGAGTGLLVHPPVLSGRIVGVSMAARFVASATVEFVSVSINITGVAASASLVTLTSNLAVVGGAFQVQHATAPQIADADTASNPSGAGSMVGSPVWANGWRGPRRAFTEGDLTWISGALRIAGGSTSLVGPVTFWIAG